MCLVQHKVVLWVITARLCSVESLQVELCLHWTPDCILLKPLPPHIANSSSKTENRLSSPKTKWGFSLFSTIKQKKVESAGLTRNVVQQFLLRSLLGLTALDIWASFVMWYQFPIGPECVSEYINVVNNHLLTEDPVYGVSDLPMEEYNERSQREFEDFIWKHGPQMKFCKF